MKNSPTITVTVAYATLDWQCERVVAVPGHASVEYAVMHSGLLEEKGLDWPCEVGINSRPVDRHSKLHAGDRVELYRPLQLTPNEIRLLRAKHRLKQQQGE